VLGFDQEHLRGGRLLNLVRADYREQARRFYDDQRAQGVPNS